MALNTIISSVKHSLDDKDNVVAVLLDLSKAFDTVDHVLMLHKLHLFGFSPSSIALIKDYLSNRFNITKFGDCSSSPKLVEVGIPQGSILGVILFIIFINDMCHLDISSNLTLFADDTTMIYSHKSISICLKTLASDLAVIENWLKNNRLILNLKKTNAMLFSNGCRSNLIDDNIKLESNGINIPFVTSFKLLGVIVDNKLKFDLHTISICRKVCFKIHTLKKCAYLFDLTFRIILFKLFIQSSFDYCSTLFFHFSNKSDSDRLEKSFSKAINKFLNIKLYVLSE